MQFNESYLLLSTQTALLGAIVPALRAVTVGFNEKMQLLTLHFFYDTEVTEDLYDLASCASAEIELDPESPYQYKMINEDLAIRLDYPQPIPLQGRLVYLRKEEIPISYPQVTYVPDKNLLPMSVFRLAMQEALLGKVLSSLRKVIIDLNQDEKLLLFQFFYHGEISKREIELSNSVIQEARRPFPGFQIKEQVVSWDDSQPISSQGQPVYSQAIVQD